MALSWSGRRKLLYTTVAGFLALFALAFAYQTFFAVAPTCFDQVQNGDERGVDCGGSCALVCRNDSLAPKVLWSRVFLTSPDTYTAAAYVENDNRGAGARRVGYAFQVYDADNQLLIERDGTMDLPPTQVIAVVEPNLHIPNNTPARVLFSFDGEPVWSRVPADAVPKLTITGQTLGAGAARLTATLTNESFNDVHSVVVAAVLFDASGTALAAGKSTLSVDKRSSVPVVFTFPGGVANVARAELTVLPPF